MRTRPSLWTRSPPPTPSQISPPDLSRALIFRLFYPHLCHTERTLTGLEFGRLYLALRLKSIADSGRGRCYCAVPRSSEHLEGLGAAPWNSSGHRTPDSTTEPRLTSVPGSAALLSALRRSAAPTLLAVSRSRHNRIPVLSPRIH